eukprot:TRINITY_DN22139_c0_g1_i2.p1 TRINITY_DN22139_c0_g1~~TRINITY_DN22139_c0_g1_i2.p1  ORF type:complete len:285 (+),score=101.94 TRINITY_DN22139_c0_g1_i2:111-965(+)
MELERWPPELNGPLHDFPKKTIARSVARSMRVVERCALSGLQPPPGHQVVPLPKLSGPVPRQRVEDLYRVYSDWYGQVPESKRIALGLTDAATTEVDAGKGAEGAMLLSWARWQHPQTCFKRLWGAQMVAAHADALSDLASQESLARGGLEREEGLRRRALCLDASKDVLAAVSLAKLRRRESDRLRLLASRRASAARLEDTESRRADEKQRQSMMPHLPGRLRWELRDYPELRDTLFCDQRQDVGVDEAGWRSSVEADEQVQRAAFVHYEHQASPQRAVRFTR